MNFKKIKKIIGYKHEITLGDIAQILLLLVIGYIGGQIQELVKYSGQEWYEENKLYFLDDSSNFTIVGIDPEKKKVGVQFFCIEGKKDDTLLMGKQIAIPAPQGRSYTFMLIDIKVIEGRKLAKIMVGRERKE